MPLTVRFVMLKATSINPILLGSIFASFLNFWLKTWLLDEILAMLSKQSKVEQLHLVLSS